MRVRPATPLSIILLVVFVLLLLSVLTTPIIPAVRLASFGSLTFGVFGYCDGEGSSARCSGVRIGYDMSALSPSSDFSLPSGARDSLTNLLIVHPIAALFALICLLLSVLSHLHGPAHSPRYLLALVIIYIPTFLLSLLAFLVDILIFFPHLEWAGWVVLAATILIALAGIVTCGMRRTLVSKVARSKRIQEGADMNTPNYYAQQQPPPAVTAPSSVISGDKLSEFATFEVDKPRGGPEGERIPLNPRSRTVSPKPLEERVGGGQPLRRAPSDRSDGYGPPQRNAGPLSRPMPPGQVRGQYSRNSIQTGTSGSSGPYGVPPRGYGGGNGHGGDRYGIDGPQGGYRGPGNGPGMFNPGAGLAPPPRRGPGPGQFGPRGPPPGVGGPYGGRGQYGMGPQGGMRPRHGMGPDNGMDPMGPRNGMGLDNGMEPRNIGPEDGMGPQGGIGSRNGMGLDNGMGPMGPRNGMRPENDMGPRGPYRGMMSSPGPGGRSMPQREYDYPADEPAANERQEFEKTLPPVGGIGAAATTEDHSDDGHSPVELAGDIHREPSPPRLAVVNNTPPAARYHDDDDDEYIPPRAAWNGQTTGTPPPGRVQTPPVELPAVESPSSRATVVSRPSGSYYEDVAPVFANMHAHSHPAALIPGTPPLPFQAQDLPQPQNYQPQDYQPQDYQQQNYQQQQMALEDLQDGQRSPAMSTTSNFTSISQRPQNPNWQPGYTPPMPGQMGMGGPAPRRGPSPSQLLGGNPDFALPGIGPRSRGPRGLGR